MVQQADGTQQAGPFYILLVDMFRGHVPDEYGEEDHIVLDSDSAWREEIIEPTLNAAKLFCFATESLQN